MIHTSQAQLMVIETDCHARAQQGGYGSLSLNSPATRIDIVRNALKFLRVVIDGAHKNNLEEHPDLKNGHP
jgi:hypothetical protein